MRNPHRIFVGNFEGRRDHLGDAGVGFRIILNWILVKCCMNLLRM
jgi:hypothetical protein